MFEGAKGPGAFSPPHSTRVRKSGSSDELPEASKMWSFHSQVKSFSLTSSRPCERMSSILSVFVTPLVRVHLNRDKEIKKKKNERQHAGQQLQEIGVMEGD